MEIDQQFKIRENRLRRVAARRGYLLRKSRRRDVGALDYGRYVLISNGAGNRRAGAQAPISALARGEGMTLDEIEAELASLSE